MTNLWKFAAKPIDYSKYHPEEFPEEFQRFHRAYQEAMEYAKDDSSSPTTFVESTTEFVIDPTVASHDNITVKGKHAFHDHFTSNDHNTSNRENLSNDVTFSEIHNHFLSDSTSLKTLHVQKLVNYSMNDIKNIGLDNYLQSPLNDFMTDTFYEFGGDAEFLMAVLLLVQITMQLC